MSGFQNNGPKIPNPGEGRMRPPKERKSDKSPHFRGLVNYNGQIISISAWYQPAASGQSGPMPESFSLKVQPYVPGAQTAGAQGAYQQPMQYGAPPQQQAYAPQPQQPVYGQPPQQGQYAPQPPPQQAHRGYQPAPQATQPPPYQPPQNGAYGAPAAQQRPAAPNYGAPGSTFVADDIPFAPSI